MNQGLLPELIDLILEHSNLLSNASLTCRSFFDASQRVRKRNQNNKTVPFLEQCLIHRNRLIKLSMTSPYYLLHYDPKFIKDIEFKPKQFFPEIASFVGTCQLTCAKVCDKKLMFLTIFGDIFWVRAISHIAKILHLYYDEQSRMFFINCKSTNGRMMNKIFDIDSFMLHPSFSKHHAVWKRYTTQMEIDRHTKLNKYVDNNPMGGPNYGAVTQMWNIESLIPFLYHDDRARAICLRRNKREFRLTFDTFKCHMDGDEVVIEIDQIIDHSVIDDWRLYSDCKRTDNHKIFNLDDDNFVHLCIKNNHWFKINLIDSSITKLDNVFWIHYDSHVIYAPLIEGKTFTKVKSSICYN